MFAVTQVTTLLSRDLSWSGFGHGMLVLALVWWAWSAYVWAANAEQEESRVLRGVLLHGRAPLARPRPGNRRLSPDAT